MAPEKIPEDELREDFHRVVEILGEVPTVDEYDEMGTYSSATLTKRIGDGSYIRAVRSLGYEYAPDVESVSTEALRQEFEELVEELDRVPSSAEYIELSSHSASTFSNRFGDGSYPDAVRALGYEYTSSKVTIDTDELQADFERVVNLLGRVPTSREYDQHRDYSKMAIIHRFGDGSYVDAVRSLGFEYNEAKRTVSEDVLREDFEAVVDQLGEVPSEAQYDTYGSYSSETLKRRIGNGQYSDAIRSLGYGEE